MAEKIDLGKLEFEPEDEDELQTFENLKKLKIKLPCPREYETATEYWEECDIEDHCAGCGGTKAEHVAEANRVIKETEKQPESPYRFPTFEAFEFYWDETTKIGESELPDETSFNAGRELVEQSEQQNCHEMNELKSKISDLELDAYARGIKDNEHKYNTWTPTIENVNSLPEKVRDYVAGLATLCDPAGIVAENTLLGDEIDILKAALEKEKQCLRNYLIFRLSIPQAVKKCSPP